MASNNQLVTFTRGEPEDPLPGAKRFLELARGVKVTCAEEAAIAADDIAEFKRRRNALKAKSDEGKRPAKEIIEWIDGLFKPAIEAFDEAERIEKAAIADFSAQERRKAEEDRRKREQEAAAERARLATEAQERELESRRLAESGDAERAEAVLAEAEEIRVASSVVAVAQIVEPPKVAGIQMRDNWGYEVTDFKALVQAVAAGRVPLLALEHNSKFLTQQARAMRDSLDYPGVVAKNTPVVASTTRRAA